MNYPRANIYVAADRLRADEPGIAIDSGKPTIDFVREVTFSSGRIVQDKRGLRGREIKCWVEATNVQVIRDD